MDSLESAARVRAALLGAHDALVVGTESIGRAIAAIEAAWPQLPPTGRFRLPPVDGTVDHAADDDLDEEGGEDEPSALAAAAAALSAVRALQPPPAPPSFPLSLSELRRLLATYGDDTDRQHDA
jgi:hypothetical protein